MHTALLDDLRQLRLAVLRTFVLCRALQKVLVSLAQLFDLVHDDASLVCCLRPADG